MTFFHLVILGLYLEISPDFLKWSNPGENLLRIFKDLTRSS